MAEAGHRTIQHGHFASSPLALVWVRSVSPYAGSDRRRLAGASTDADTALDVITVGRWNNVSTSQSLTLYARNAELYLLATQVLEKNFPLRTAARSLNPSPAVPSRAAAARAGMTVPPAAAGAQPKVSLAALGKRVLADQAVMAPFGLVLFIGSMGIMEGRTTQDLKEKYQDVRLLA